MTSPMNHRTTERPADAAPQAHGHTPIPGELDATTEAPTEQAIVGTTGYGGDLPADGGPPIDAETKRRFEWEGGGKR